jgi:hypothetical protein
VCYSRAHFGLETVDGEVIENNSDILAHTTYVLSLRLKDEWGCDIDCIPLKQAAQQHLTLHADGPKLKMLCAGSAKSLHPRFLTEGTWFEEDERHVFSTVIACLSGFRGADRARTWEQIVRGGGAVSTALTSNCTHLVTSELRGDKCRKAMDMDNNIAIVPAMWVTRSLQNRRKEDEDSYCARKPLGALVQVATDPLLYHGQEVRAPLCVP